MFREGLKNYGKFHFLRGGSARVIFHFHFFGFQKKITLFFPLTQDQLDLMREQWHNLSDTSGRYEDDGLGVLAPFSGKLTSLHSEAKLTSLRSEACLVSTSHSQSNLLEHSYTVSQNNLALLAASKVII